MQASRASSRALKAFAAGSMQTRSLSITGSTTFSSLLTSERPALNLPRDVAGLRAECKKRKLPTSGTMDELTNRLSAHELANTRGFSTAVQSSKRPVPSAVDLSKPVRHFNTSRSLKAVNDSSTIDFAYLPENDLDVQSAPAQFRVPILPQTIVSDTTNARAIDESEEAVMRPTIVTAAADSTHIHAPSAMSEVSDNGSVDFQGMIAQVTTKLSSPVEEGAGMTKQIWKGLVEDILGSGPQGPARA